MAEDIYLLLNSHRSYPDNWYPMHASDDEMFLKPLFATSMGKAEILMNKIKKEQFKPNMINEYNFKISKISKAKLEEMLEHANDRAYEAHRAGDLDYRKKKSSKSKPKRKVTKKKSCGCK